jgi:glyoxylate reductase
MPAGIIEVLRRDFTLIEEPVGADGVLTLFNTVVDEPYLDHAGPQLRIVANYAAGTNNIDLDAARRRGVTVTNTPGVLTTATAELTVTLMLTLLRRVVEGDRLVRAREPWSMAPDFMLGEGLDGKTLTIVGPGRIGRETARLASAFGARVEWVGRDDDLIAAIAGADVVSIHCPLLPETRHLIDETVLRHMQRSAVLVNTARGPIVDEGALAQALSRGDIAGAALDVYEFEPNVTETLLSLRNVVLTPHIGSGTRRTREQMGMLAVNSLRSVLVEGRRPETAVT